MLQFQSVFTSYSRKVKYPAAGETDRKISISSLYKDYRPTPHIHILEIYLLAVMSDMYLCNYEAV